LFPTYSRRERVADAAVHIAGVAFGIAGAAGLMLSAFGKSPARDIVGLAVYSVGLIAMFAASAFYNLVHEPALKERLRRLDHAAIFLMIAGSYTPFALIKIGGETGFALLAAVWGIALFGIAVKLWFPRRFDGVSVALYLAQGWVIIFALGPLIASVPQRSVILLLVGGCIYTAGVAFHLLERLPFHNVVWHIFVLGGAISQFLSIYEAVIP
jgi:hemolysin III